MIVQLHPNWGAPKIREKLRRLHGERQLLVVSTVHAVLDRDGFLPPAPDAGPGRTPAGHPPTPIETDPATVTGSIGVFALLPRADRALEKLGVHAEGVTTTWLVGARVPIASITTSHSTSNSLAGTATGVRRPDASGSPSSMRWHVTMSRWSVPRSTRIGEASSSI